jgi:dihydrofolate synthase/folylpolyglutamate synthase
MRPGLERTEALLEALGEPHRGLRGALVAGTNGKGSVCAVVDSVLRAASLHTVLLTKPHLVSYRERIVVDGAWVGEDEFADLIDAVTEAASSLPEALQPTGFELMTVAGILAARWHKVDALVCEVGLGGRLDSTNVLDLGVAVVTGVGLDHRQHLGNTVEEIATEKAAIIKPGNRAVTAATPPALGVVRQRSREVGATLREVAPDALNAVDHGRDGIEVTVSFAGEPLTVAAPLIGAFQAANVAVAVAACDELRGAGTQIDAAAVVSGCAAVRWRGRMQWIDGTPPVVVDGGHNPDGMRAAATAIRRLRPGRRLVAVFAAMRDKDVADMVRELMAAEPELVIVTAPSVQRATEPAELARLIDGPAEVVAAVPAAVARARELAGPDGLVLVVGSLYLAGEALSELGA